MQKLYFLLILSILATVSFAQSNRNWDKPMELQKCSINIKADLFTATTFIEMEFYNPNNQEIEGLYQFQLQPGQAITSLQLDLFGKFRDGTIEEKWKARNAYNTIVGKRVDPALLQMDAYNSYSLRIYPIAAKSTRRITMTIQQLLKGDGQNIGYYLPLTSKDKLKQFNVDIQVNHTSTTAYANDGLLKSNSFSIVSSSQQLKLSTQEFIWDKPVLFTIPLPKKDVVCMEREEDKAYFALRHLSTVPKVYSIQPKSITIFWDISFSGSKRNIEKEISFLKQYVAYYNISDLTIVPFNYKCNAGVNFRVETKENSKWVQYLRSLNYAGATQLGSIDFNVIKTDAIFLVSDGYNSLGASLPQSNKAYVFCIHASEMADNTTLNKIIGKSGGRNIDLLKQNMSDAISLTGKVENNLLDIRSASGRTIIDVEWYNDNQNESLLAGTTTTQPDTLIFEYGNNSRISAIEKVFIGPAFACSNTNIKRIPALAKFDELLKKSNWQELLFFGKDEKIVTLNTSYIVLEKAEDYVKFGIEPPKELEEECGKIDPAFNVRNAKEQKWQKAKKQTEFDILSGVANRYNERIRKWGSTDLINLPHPDIAQETISGDKNSLATGTPGSGTSINSPSFGMMGDASLNEVVVTGYAAKRKNMTGAVTTIRGDEILSTATTVEQALSGRAAGVMVTRDNSFFKADNFSSIRIRGAASVGNSSPLFVLDGMPVSGNTEGTVNINEYVNVSDIDYIEVLKDASATAIYGSRGANGVIVIQTKRGKSNYGYQNPGPYKLKSMADVAYLQEIKEVNKEEKLAKYYELQMQHQNDAGFYLDMAQHLYENGFRQEAMVILTNAAEVLPNNLSMQRTVAFFLEQWGEMDEAIALYEEILKASPADLMAYRDLGLVYDRNGQHQKAIDILYRGMRHDFEANENWQATAKEILLNDMSGIIALHRNELDSTMIPVGLVKPLPVDLRIVIEGNGGNLYGATIIEPGNHAVTEWRQPTKLGGYFTQNYYQNKVKEYQLKDAVKGTYRIRVNYYDYYSSVSKQPGVIRVTVYKNFGKPNQSVTVENVMMDNQNGIVEIAEVKF